MEEPIHHDGEGPAGYEHKPENDNLFRLVSHARDLFKVNVALISLLDDECQYFKSEVGLTDAGLRDMEGMPRDISFCGHTILNKAPMVILDCSKDWRMINNPLVCNPPHVRFYAGVPIVAPEGYALGTLCLIGLEPRTEFNGAAEMQRLSQLAMTEIKSLYERNQQEKMQRMRNALSTFPAPLDAGNVSSAYIASALEIEEPRLRAQQDFTPEQQRAVLKAGRNQGLKVVAKTGDLHADAASQLAAHAQAMPRLQESATLNGDHMLGRPLGEDDSLATTSNNLQSVQAAEQADEVPADSQELVAVSQAKNPYDLSVLLIAQTLNLDLVYLLALDVDSTGDTKTRVVSSHGLATDPVFDAGLHRRALQSKSGLLYVHPDPDSEIAKEMGTYISGMLVPVLQASGGGGGYVLAAFTKKKSQIFVAEDLKFLKDFGISLMKWLLAADAKALESSKGL